MDSSSTSYREEKPKEPMDSKYKKSTTSDNHATNDKKKKIKVDINLNNLSAT